MRYSTASGIEKLCDNWCNASEQDSEVLLTMQAEKYRLLSNDIKFHELDYDALCAAIIGLSKVLLRKNLNTIIHTDHLALWSWCGEVLFNGEPRLFPLDQNEIKSLYKTSVHAALAKHNIPSRTREEEIELRRIESIQPHHAKHLLEKSSLILAYLSFPLLEAVLKRSCSEYVSYDGLIKKFFTITKQNGKARNYEIGDKISSLRDLLFLHRNNVANKELKFRLDAFNEHLRTLDPSQHPFDLIYRWRNQTLHGSTNFNTIGGTLLNLSLLISIAEIENSFENYRSVCLNNLILDEQRGERIFWSFYPPY